MPALTRHLTYANVIATLALFLALGGASYAAIKLPKNSVGSKQIRTGAVTSSDIKNNSIKPGDFKGGLPSGPRGPQGEAAAKLWARIGAGATPTVLDSSGGVTVSRAGNGVARVTFPSDITRCSVQLTNQSGVAARFAHPLGEREGGTFPVSTYSLAGGAVTSTTDGFDIAVFC